MKVVALALLLGLVAAVQSAPLVPLDSELLARAQAGDADAQFGMGEAYRSGRGVEANPQSAIMWYRRAAVHGHVRAGEELGFALFAYGDRREAMPYVEAAAARGEARAFYLLGTAHFNGDYVARDWPLAYAQTMRAAAAGLPAAQRNLEVMDRYLLPADKAKAQQILATLPPLRQPLSGDATAAAASPDDTSASSAALPVKTARKMSRPVKSTAAAASSDSPTEPAPESSGNYRVQLGAYASANRARERWQVLVAKVPALSGHGPRVVTSGSIQRLRADGLSKSDAQSLCVAVRKTGGDCIVLAP